MRAARSTPTSGRARYDFTHVSRGFLDIQIGITLIHGTLRNRPAATAAAAAPHGGPAASAEKIFLRYSRPHVEFAFR